VIRQNLQTGERSIDLGYLGAVGLLRRDRCLPEIEQKTWNYYRLAPNDRSPGVWSQIAKDVVDREWVSIACLGVFDTVGALGIPLTALRRHNRQRFEFHDVELNPIVRVNLANRVPYAPTLWREGAGIVHRTGLVSRCSRRRRRWLLGLASGPPLAA
jgi:hypothetical protein